MYINTPNPPIFDKEGLFVFFPNNKCGQTSVTGGSSGQHKEGALAGRCIVKKAQPKHWQELALKNWSEATKFTIIRHPYHRFLSTYRYLKQFYDYATLDEFIALVKKNGFFDPHLQEQWTSAYTSEGKCFVNYILHLETIEQEWEIFRNKIRAKSFPKLNQTNPKEVSLTSAQREIIQSLYVKDFERFKFNIMV